MKLFYIFVLVYTCLYPLYCDCQSVGPSCNLNNCNGTNVEICATNGQHCKRFASECALQRDYCNATLATVWNRTDTIQCLNLRSNASGLCACPALRTCSNRPTTTGVCAHRDGHDCRLFRTECDLTRARCNSEVWHNIDVMQCSGFTLGETRTCICPKSLQCSRNQTQLCVQVAANNCRLYGNECELEAARCRGERLQDVNNVQCRNFSLGETKTCQCPRLFSCQQNVTNICVRNEQRRCHLVGNECELEQQRCEGSALNKTLPAQCHSLRPGESGKCACPALETCSVNRTNICVKTRIGCRLKRNECELEQSRCQGEVLERVSRLQCNGFQPGEGRACACPRLNTCSRNNTNICVGTIQGCKLLRNECELEQAKCEGERLSIVDSIQCRNFTVNELRNCSCPSVGICDGITRFCTISNRSQCKVFANQCELQKARCLGEVWSVTHQIQCRSLSLNATGNCFCPDIRNCSYKPRYICVRENSNNSSCLLLRNECELVQAICEGKDFKRVDNIHCKNFAFNTSTTCFCSNLRTCNHNSSSICVKTASQCRLMRNECELEQAKCEGENLQKTQAIQCLNFNINTQRNCSCSNLLTCSQNSTKICARTRRGCKLLTTQCQLEEGKCRGEVFKTTSLQHCLGIELGQTRNCSCPNLKTCSRNNTNICVRTKTGCSLIRNECELEQLRCQDENLRILPAIQCKLIRPGTTGTCACPKWLNCQQNSTNVCIETLSECRLLKNQCELEQLKCQREALNITSNLQCQGFAVGQQRQCACPELKTCSNQNSTNICVRNSNGCKLLENSCDLELAKCKGEKWCSVDPVQCQNFSVGHQRNCTCPNMATCSKNNATNICVQMKGACKLMKNHCELEKAKCKGQAWSPTSAIQCQNYKPNQWRWCACPRLLNCCSKQKPFCVKSPQGCKLMKTDCELQMARCKGEKWSRADELECKGFRIGQSVQNCTCSKLATCLQNNSSSATTTVCIRNVKGCKLLRNECELERLLCSGEVWQPVKSIQCRNFPFHETRSCHCPSLGTCSNTTRVCGKMPGNQCSLFRSECDMRLSQCEGNKLTLTLPQRCQSIRFDATDVCRCPELRGCNRRLRICGRKGQQCKLFRNECDFRNSTCLEENWQRTSEANCCKFASGEVKNCTLSMSTAVCGMLSNQCRLFSSRCAFDTFNLRAPRKWRLVNRSNCQCIRTGRTARCARRPTCRPTNTRRVCARHGRNVMLFNSQCHLVQHNYRRCTSFRAVRAAECRNIRG